MDDAVDTASIITYSENADDFESELLHAARNGDIDGLKLLLDDKKNDKISLNINCIGRNKANRGWSALHLASYFGHGEAVRLLIENGADINVSNDVGDSPLHRAAFTGRQEIVLMLLQHGADVNLINAEGNSACQVAKTAEIKSLIGAAVKTEQRMKEEAFLKAAREGQHETVAEMLKSNNAPNVNCTDSFGNTALHLAAMRGRKAVIVVLLQAGIDASLCNSRGQRAVDMTSDVHMRLLLDVKSNHCLSREIHRHEGTLFKKIRLLGWRPVWVVLERGVLSVFNSRADATTGSNRKWFKYLDGAKVQQNRLDTPQLLVIVLRDGKSIVFSVGLDPGALITRQKWENALLEHISYSLRIGGGRVIDDDRDDEILPLGSLQDTLKTAQAHQQVLEKQVSSVLAHLGNTTDNITVRSSTLASLPQIFHLLTEVAESSRNTSAALSQCLSVFIQQEQVRRVQLEQEMEKSRVLEESLRVLAQEHLHLERSITGMRSPAFKALPAAGTPSVFSNSEADEFFDCEVDDSSDSETPVSVPNVNGMNSSVATFSESLEHDKLLDSTTVKALAGIGVGLSAFGSRSRLPVPMFSRSNLSVWSILKQCIGRELSKITMPVVFNEPLSFLQRMVEYMEYAELLKQASCCDDPVERLELVTTFAMSATASNWDRLGKPFNPLLGETYHLDREIFGYRIICEQVSHHPPVSAFHCESEDFIFHGAIEPKLKFWGKSVEVTPKGIVTLYLKKHNEAYSWQYVNCCIHNIIVGKIWIEHYGTMEVVNHHRQLKAVVNYKSCGWFGSDLHKLEGAIFDKSKTKLRSFYGKWTDAFYSCDVKVWEEFGIQNAATTQIPNLEDGMGSQSATDEVDEAVRADGVSGCPQLGASDAATEVSDEESLIVSGDMSVYDLQLSGQKLLWKATPKPPYNNQYYNFTFFAMMLNELSDSERPSLPPTDSRLRPDIRRMEDGDIDGAADEKNRLEEKQRAARKERGGDSSWKPRWFALGRNIYTGKQDWHFTNEYWHKDWSQCPDIF